VIQTRGKLGIIARRLGKEEGGSNRTFYFLDEKRAYRPSLSRAECMLKREIGIGIAKEVDPSKERGSTKLREWWGTPIVVAH